MWRLIAAAMLLGSALSLSAPAAAQGNPAKEHYMQGVALFEAGNYKAALAEFLESYEARPNWKLRHTIAICYFNLNRFVNAKKELDLYVAEGGNEVPEDKRVEVEDMLLQISKLTAKVEIEVNVDGAAIWIDDEKAATSPMKHPLTLDSGVYELEITAPGYVKYKRDLKLVGGDKKVYDITLVSKGGEVEPDEPDKKPDKKPKKKPKKKKAKGPRSKDEKVALGLLVGSLISAGLAAGSGVGIMVAGIDVQNMKKDHDACPQTNPGRLLECYSHYAEQGENSKKIVNALLGPAIALGAASIGLGVGHAIKKKKIEKSGEAKALNPPLITPLVTGDSFYLSISGTF